MPIFVFTGLIALDAALLFLLRKTRLLSLDDKDISSSIGGLIPIINFIGAILAGAYINIPVYVLVGFGLIVLLGLYDDRFGTKAPSKLIVQTVAAALVLINFYPGPWEYLAGILVIVALSNIINLADGIDGVCATLGILLLGFFLLTGSEAKALAGTDLAVLAGLVVFTIFNFLKKQRVILGDTGSLFLGFYLGYKLVAVWQVEHSPANLHYFILLMAYPIADTLYAVVRRARLGHPLFRGDRSHLHHLLADQFHSSRRASVLLIMLNVGLLLITVPLFFAGQHWWAFWLATLAIPAWFLYGWLRFALLHPELSPMLAPKGAVKPVKKEIDP